MRGVGVTSNAAHTQSMPSSALVFLAVVALMMIAWVVIAPKIPGALEPLQSESKTLLDLRHRLWGEASDEAGVDLLDRTRVVFVQMNGWEQSSTIAWKTPAVGKSGWRLNSHGRGSCQRMARVRASRPFESRSAIATARDASRSCALGAGRFSRPRSLTQAGSSLAP